MTTRKRGSNDGDSFSAETRARIAKQQGEVLHVVAPQLFHQASHERVERVLEDMIWLVGRGDGWMRWTADRDGKQVWLKYKFTSLHFPNHYVMVSGPIYDVSKLVGALVRKCELVDAGQLVPTYDRPYHPLEE